MAQEQPRKPEGVKYGDVFDVSGQLASKVVAPRDAATMQSAENIVLGHTQKGGPAAVMQSAADVNESRGVVAHKDVTYIVKDQGVTVVEAEVAGLPVITEAVGGQVVGQFVHPGQGPTSPPVSAFELEAITIGEALEATALSAGDKPIDDSDAAAIQSAETRATGLGHVVPGGVGAKAQSAASLNPRKMRDDEKTRISDVLGDATARLPDDKPVTKEDADAVIAAEIRNDPEMATHPGGVAQSVAAAATLNLLK